MLKDVYVKDDFVGYVKWKMRNRSLKPIENSHSAEARV